MKFHDYPLVLRFLGFPDFVNHLLYTIQSNTVICQEQAKLKSDNKQIDVCKTSQFALGMLSKLVV